MFCVAIRSVFALPLHNRLHEYTGQLKIMSMLLFLFLNLLLQCNVAFDINKKENDPNFAFFPYFEASLFNKASNNFTQLDVQKISALYIYKMIYLI